MASVQTLIIAILLKELVQGGALRVRRCELQLKAQRGKELRDFRKAKFRSATVFERIEGGTTDPRLLRKRSLGKLQGLAPPGDALAYRSEVEHMPNILGLAPNIDSIA